MPIVIGRVIRVCPKIYRVLRLTRTVGNAARCDINDYFVVNVPAAFASAGQTVGGDTDSPWGDTIPES